MDLFSRKTGNTPAIVQRQHHHSETLGQGTRLALAPRRQCDVGMTGVLPGGGPFCFAMTNDVDTMHEFTHRTSCLER